MSLTFWYIADAEPQRSWRGRRRGAPVQTKEDAQHAVLLARLVIMEDPKHNPMLADALLGVTAFLE